MNIRLTNLHLHSNVFSDIITYAKDEKNTLKVPGINNKEVQMIPLSQFFIASDRPDGGAVLLNLTSDLEIERTAFIPMTNPTWITLDGGRICAALRDRSGTEKYAEFSAADGRQLTPDMPTGGKSLCHFTKAGDDIYCANYSTGDVMYISGNGSKLIKHTPDEKHPVGCDATRQDRAYCHQCLLSPDKKYVLVCDLGLDTVFVYDRQMNYVSDAKVPSGHGPRHSIFTSDGKTLYTLSEMASSVSRFAWDDGRLTYIDTVSAKPETHVGLSDSAEIVLSPDGKHLYASCRGTCNTICHMAVNADGSLTVISHTPSGGDHPRDFRLIADGRYAVACNTFSDNLTLFSVEKDGELKYIKDYSIPSPLCLAEV